MPANPCNSAGSPLTCIKSKAARLECSSRPKLPPRNNPDPEKQEAADLLGRDVMALETLTLYERRSINYRSESGVLGIAAGNFASEKYLDEKGAEKRRATAGVWVRRSGHTDT